MHPTLIPAKRLIANVEGAMNAVLVKGDAVGATLYYGAGAGAEPTASAVIADLVDVTRLHTADPEHRVPHLAFQPDELSDLPILPMGEVVTALLPAHARRRPARRAGRHHAHPGRPRHLDRRDAAEGAGRRARSSTDIIMLTHDSVEGPDDDAIDKMEALPTVRGKVVRIRKEELGVNVRRARAATSASRAASARSCSKASRPTAG